MEIRDLTDADTAAVLDLNSADVKLLSPMDADDLARARETATAVRVAEVDGQVVGFIVLYGPDADYRSINFRWHRDLFTDFLYLDRIVVDESRRRQGIASALYDEAERLATPHGRLCAEVNYQPPNEASLAFHAARDYSELGTLTQTSGTVCVMLAKELEPSAE